MSPTKPPAAKAPAGKPPPRSASRRKRERRREAALRAQTQPGGRRRTWIWGGAGGGLVVAVVVLVLLLRGGTATPSTNASTPTATPNIPQLASLATAATGAAVDSVQCQTMEQFAYHIHAHLAVYVNGSPRQIPDGIGITKLQEQTTNAGPFATTAGGCYYWLHTHTSDGIIHIESPTQQLYTLGTFFDIWGQPLTAGQVGSAKGTVTAYVDGQPYTGDVRAITLTAHELIQLDVGANQPPQPFSFPPGL
jgi:hypothetical protein